MVAAKAALAKASFEEALEQKTAAVEHAIEKATPELHQTEPSVEVWQNLRSSLSSNH